MFRSLMGDFYEPFTLRNPMIYDRVDYYVNPSYFRENVFEPRRQARASGIEQSDSTFKVMLDVSHFQRNEIDVKTVDNFVVVHGKHEELADEHGFVSREFTRRYKLPEDVEPDKVTSSLSKNGILTIKAPRKVHPLPKNERVVPIAFQQQVAVEEAQKTQVQQHAAVEEAQKSQAQQHVAVEEAQKSQAQQHEAVGEAQKMQVQQLVAVEEAQKTQVQQQQPPEEPQMQEQEQQTEQVSESEK